MRSFHETTISNCVYFRILKEFFLNRRLCFNKCLLWNKSCDFNFSLISSGMIRKISRYFLSFLMCIIELVISRNPSVFVSIMEQKVKAEQQSSNQMMTFNVNGKSELKPILNERTTEIVQLLLNEAVHGEWDTQPQAASNAPLAPPQVLLFYWLKIRNYEIFAKINSNCMLLLSITLWKTLLYNWFLLVICSSLNNGVSFRRNIQNVKWKLVFCFFLYDLYL